MTVHGFTLNIPFKSITKYLEIRIYLHSSQFTLISNDFGSLFSFFFFFCFCGSSIYEENPPTPWSLQRKFSKLGKINNNNCYKKLSSLEPKFIVFLYERD